MNECEAAAAAAEYVERTLSELGEIAVRHDDLALLAHLIEIAREEAAVRAARAAALAATAVDA